MLLPGIGARPAEACDANVAARRLPIAQRGHMTFDRPSPRVLARTRRDMADAPNRLPGALDQQERHDTSDEPYSSGR
jgi:hypothetical protein